MNNLRETFGEIDIYLFDQILKGRIGPGMRLLDAGCGWGRNLVYLRGAGVECFGVDQAAAMGDWEGFRVAKVEEMPFENAYFDVVLSSAVLHFAQDSRHFRAMVDEMWRVLRPGGLLFCRLATTIGMPEVAEGRTVLPDGSERFVVSAETLLGLTRELGGRLAEPLKSTVVHGERSMGTWVVWKGAAG